jgi:transcriptional regulator with XRE-family HTH domain
VTSPEPTVPSKSSLGDLLREARHARGLTLEELSSRAAVGVRTLGDLERHRITRPHRRTLQALVDALGLTAGEGDAVWAAARPAAAARTPEGPEPYTSVLAVGRAAEMRAFDRWFGNRPADRRGEPMVISGMPGVGKTAFGREICARYRNDFPDGQIFLNLGGSGPAPMTPFAALGHLLEFIGVPRAGVPGTVEDRGLLYRARMTGRRAIVGLDDARDEAQVRPLVADQTSSLTIVTSRRTLGGLDASGSIILTELTRAGARDLFERVLGGPERIAAEPAAADALGELCGLLPLGLRIAATRLANRPRMKIGELVERMRLLDDRLSWLAAGDVRLRAVLAGHYEMLTEEQRRAFRRLSLLPAQQVTSTEVAPLLGVDIGAAEQRLEDLVDAGMLTAGTGAGHYCVNPVMRLYAREAMAADESAASIERLLRASRLLVQH